MSGITLKHVTPATIPTPAAGKSTIFINDSDADTPYYKDPAGVSTSLKGAAGDGYDTVQAHGNTGATETFDYVTADFHTATLDANCTFTFTGATNGKLAILGLRLTQDGTGSRTVTWPASVTWAEAGTAPTLQTAAAAVDEVWFDSTDGGTIWYGHYGRLPLTTRGDLLTRSATANVRLAVGAANTYLGSDGTDPSWSAVTDAKLSTSDITTNDASTSKHGFLKKLSNVSTEFMNGQGNWATPAGGGGGITFKRTVLNGNGNKTTTSTTKVAIDTTNLAYLTLTLAVGDVVRCSLYGAAKHSSGTANSGFDFEVDQPTSADTFVGSGADYGVTKRDPSIERCPVAAVGLFTATEAGSHGFRPAWLTDAGTLTMINAASSDDDVLITFIVEKLGAPAA